MRITPPHPSTDGDKTVSETFAPPFNRNCFLVTDSKGREVVHTGLLGRRRLIDDEATAQLIVDALNASPPEDDDEPTTADWLRSIGFYEDETDCYLIQEDERGWLLSFLLDDDEPQKVVSTPGSASWRGDDMLETCKVGTRGDVRRLMVALGMKIA